MSQLGLNLPPPPVPREWEQCVLPCVSFQKDEIQMLKTRVGPFLYGISGGECRELIALKIDLTGPTAQQVVVRGQTYRCYIEVRPNGNHPGWVNVGKA